MRLIDADALKKTFENSSINGLPIGDLYRSVLKVMVDNAPTIDTTCPNCDSGYAQGYSDGYLQGKEERPTGEWIPVTTCDMTEEDAKELLDDSYLEDFYDAPIKNILKAIEKLRIDIVGDEKPCDDCQEFSCDDCEFKWLKKGAEE